MGTTVQVIGWIGMVLIVGAYFLISYGHVTSKGLGYKLMNLVGSVSVGVNVWYNHAWPALALQVVWIIITLLSFRRP